MKPWDNTTMGGGDNHFKTTQWSRILSLKTKDETRRRMILNNLTETYWKPVYCYLRSKGFDNDAAKDITQNFFFEIILGRELIQKADQSKGKFRNFLLVALERYVVSTLRYEGRIRRGGRAKVIHMVVPDLANLYVPESSPDPNHAFCYAWVSTLLDQVLTEIKEEYCSTQRAGHWEVFHLRVLAPIFENIKKPSYKEICEKHNIADESKVANMIVTVKRRFRSVLRRNLRNLARTDAEADEEFAEIFRILSQ
ncbi:MAG: sigma-70 family RNA polymerase sigma factor [Planctomycetes bacterium]|nr:sigma-70 family RNA polymerase sigma factor [Planctomycetota bacterium]